MSAQTQTQTVQVENEGGIFRITLNRPDALNAVNIALATELEAALDRAAADDSVRVVVLSGNGRGFCSGADLNRDRNTEDSDSSDDVLAKCNRITQKITAMAKPVVGAINGVAAGVGASFALACDLVVAKENAYFLLAFTNIALMPDGGATLLVPALVGRARAQEMALLGKRIPAAKAYEWGMIYRCANDADYDPTITELTDRFTHGAPLAFGLTKQAINAATIDLLVAAQEREGDGQRNLTQSKDFAEAVLAFREKRPAHFTGE